MVRVVVGVVDIDGVDVVGKVVKKLLNVVAVVVGMVVIGVADSDVFEKGVVVGVIGGIDEDD